MDPLSIAGSVSGLVALGELILRRLYRYACHVKNAEKEATELRDEVIALNGVLSSLRVIAQEIQEDQSVSYAINLDYVNSCHATLLELLQKLDTIGLCHKDPNKVRHLTRKIMWPMKTTKFQDFIETIRRHRNNLSFALSADSMTALLKCLGNQERAMEALKAIDRRLRDQHEAETRINYGDEKSQTVVNILAALASQLGRQNEESFEILRSLYTELHPKSRLKRDPEAGELAEAIRNMAVTFDDVRLVVDGLDECSDEAGEAAHILHAIASEHVSISVVILSRDEPHIRQELPQASCHCVAIEAQTKDLDLYVRGEIERRIERKPRLLRDYELKEEMIRKLVSESQGMFGWVSCQLHYLCELSSDTARRKALNDLPRDLTDTYGRVLMRIKKHDIPLARAAFQWIAYESSGLNVDQICDIVSSMTGDDTGRYNVEDILDLCGSLVRRRGRFLELAHFTVLEFLEAIKPEDTRLAVFRLHVDCKLSLAKSCVQYLCSPAFNTPPPADECTLEAVDKEHPFRMYATVFIRRYTYDWLYDPELIEILKKLFEPRKTFNLVNFMLTLLEEATREFEDARAQVCSPEFRPLHAAALLQLSPICLWLLEQGCDVNIESPLGTPLVCNIFAYYRVKDYDHSGSGGYQHPPSDIQHEMAHLYFETTYSTAKVLLKAGAICNVRGSRHMEKRSEFRVFLRDASVGYVALQGPIHSSSPIAALLEHGLVLEQDAVGSLWNSHPNTIASFLSLLGPLETTAIAPAMYEQLLRVAKPKGRARVSDFDVTSNMTQGFFEDVMNQILEFDDLELFRYLADGPGFESYLDQYIEERWSRSDMKTAERHDLLCLVPRKKAWRILEALLDMDFDLDLTDFSGAWVLRDCVDNGCEKEHLLRRLMTQNAIKPLSCGQTMCHYLAANGNSRILELMLEMYGKELPGLWAEYKGLQPVTLAIHARSSDCALLLLGSMPSGSMRLDDWKNLHSAVAHGLEDVLEQLIELGVDPRALDSKERSALYAVTRYTSKAIIDTLLRQGLDPDHRDSLGRTAILHYLANCKESPSDGTDFVVWQNKGVTLDVVKAITTSKSVSPTVDSKDTLWHQFCVGRLPQILSELSYFSPEDENELGIGQFLLTNSTCAMYERRRNRSGISLLIKTCLDSWSVHSYAARHISSLLQTVIASIDVTIPFIQDSQAIRLLIWSVEQGDTKLTTVLLESGVDINGFSRYYNGRSAIDISCLSKVKPEIFRLLLSKADVKHLSAPDSTGSTWFHQFCVYPDRNQQYTRAPARRYEEYRHYQSHQSPTEVDIVIDKLKATLEAGANPDVTSNNICRSRAIHVAASSGFLEAIVVLDSFGANLELLDGLGWGIVSHAISSRNANLLSFVHEKFPSSELWNVKHSLFAILDGSKQQREYLDCCALHVAAIVGSRPMLQELEYVGFSKDLNAKSKDGLTPLHFAAASGEPAALRWLIDRSVDLNATFGPRNRTALHIAMEMGLVGSSLALIQAGANFNPDSGGVTPEMLIHPTQAGSFQANLIGCDAILPDQVKQNLQSRYRLQPSRSIFHGIVTGNTNQGTPFLSGYGLHEFNRPLRECGGCLPITLALAHQRYAMVDELLQKSVSTGGSTCPRLPARARGLNTTVNLAISDPNNNSRLDLILKRHSEHGTHWLLWGIQPLHVAAAFNPSSIDTLIKCVDALQDTYRNNLLQALSAKDLVGHVLNKNIYIDRTTSAPWAAGGGTPLHIAAWNRQSHAVEKLLGYGADPNSKDPRGRTPLHNAVMSGCAASMKILLQHGAMRRPLDVSLQSPLMLSCTVANADAWSLLAEPRIDASMSDLFGKTALHLSALQDNLKVFVNLVQCGWDMHKKDVHGHSPIFYALLKPQFATWIYADMCKRRETFSASECFELLKSFRCEREIRRFCRRFPEETQRCLRTSCDQQYGTRLFQMAGAAGDMKRVKALLRMVADEKLLYVRYMDISLRSACAANQANTVSQLARKIVWPTDFIEEGDPIMNMPMPETARDNPQIVNWFTARQHTEQLRLTQGNATRIPDATAIKHWSGVTTLRVHLTGSIRRPIGWSLYQYTCYCRSWGSDYWLLLLNSGNTFYMIE
ncbi:unnamed protein product [Alternaria alternata]